MSNYNTNSVLYRAAKGAIIFLAGGAPSACGCGPNIFQWAKGWRANFFRDQRGGSKFFFPRGGTNFLCLWRYSSHTILGNQKGGGRFFQIGPQGGRVFAACKRRARKN